MSKSHEKKVKEFEMKIVDLVEFKNRKMAEERDLKLKQRKEVKKAKQIATRVEKNEAPDISSIDDDFPKNDLNFNLPVSNKFDVLNYDDSDKFRGSKLCSTPLNLKISSTLETFSTVSLSSSSLVTSSTPETNISTLTPSSNSLATSSTPQTISTLPPSSQYLVTSTPKNYLYSSVPLQQFPGDFFFHRNGVPLKLVHAWPW